MVWCTIPEKGGVPTPVSFLGVQVPHKALEEEAGGDGVGVSLAYSEVHLPQVIHCDDQRDPRLQLGHWKAILLRGSNPLHPPKILHSYPSFIDIDEPPLC